ncbi:MAG: 2-oxo acid dehydrogenase subunit E2 [Flammeovirgaceae bacterium]|jgi:2-oxoglutarate dehydrogenase E2 component (dihydrolipoamide succinyltransferase)|nr:2-oxo acid dehydrogenase subunit E2 [Flammeovirgaceae bacterium]|tara:strand:+ start:4842 stop:6128 length:1287 start_codon:yes stop_codon:yes gene_type:complete
MASIEMIMPKMGESVMEGTILSWLKKVGDSVEEDESVLEVGTDKVDTEIPSTHAGILKEILAQEGEVVQVGKPIAIIELSHTKQETFVEKQLSREVENLLDTAIKEEISRPEIERYSKSNRFYSPLVRNIAKAENIKLEQLEQISGSGKEGRITKIDILKYLEDTKKKIQLANSPIKSPTVLMPETHSSIQTGTDEIIEMDRMRKIIAERMIASRSISAHVTSFVEADMTQIVSWRNKVKNGLLERTHQSITFTPIIIEAIAKAIKDFPMINIQVNENRIIKKKNINIGVAVALSTGNLIVPVLKNADRLSLLEIVVAVNDLALRARNNTLKPDELDGGTFTVSNVGSFGNVMGTPIIMQPQVAILALGAIQKKPAVIETPEGDFIGIRHKIFLSHSYDHRVVDGALGGSFVRRVADYLEKFDITQHI